MILPNLPVLFASTLATLSSSKKDKTVASGSVLDYCGNECIDDAGDTHCTKPFALVKDSCYNFEWKTDGKVTHTTMEVRKVTDNKNVFFYKDINGEWTSPESTLVYLDFVPRIGCNSTVTYAVSHCK